MGVGGTSAGCIVREAIGGMTIGLIGVLTQGACVAGARRGVWVGAGGSVSGRSIIGGGTLGLSGGIGGVGLIGAGAGV